MPIVTILGDTREQKGYTFDRYPVEFETATLSTGDYTIAEFCDHDESLDTYHPRFAIERKAPNDLLSSITGDARERFKAEIKRASEWPEPLKVVVEAPWSMFENNHGVMQYRGLTPAQVTGTVREWSEYYNVEFHFFSDRHSAEQFAFDELITCYRTQ